MKKELIKGNEAIVKASILAGCTHYFGYPITPASEVAQAAAYFYPLLGRTFVQAESEVSAINMVYGASAAGVRCMTASSGPGMSLKMEGISYLAGADLPAVIVDVMRAGPGLGNIFPEQSDYNQIVKGGGHGNYKNIVLAPNSAQEMCDFTLQAFELADKYRCVVFVLTDGSVGQTMEPVEFPEEVKRPVRKDWAVQGTAATRENLVTSIFMSPEDLRRRNEELQAKYAEIEAKEVMYEAFMTDGADLVVSGYGVISRIMEKAVEELRAEGMKIGMLRPKTLFPFPKKQFMDLTKTAKAFLVAEMSNGQMVDDVKLSIEHKRPVDFYGTFGGKIPSIDEMKKVIAETYRRRVG